MDTDLRIKFTKHAQERMLEAGLTYKQSIWMLQTAIKEKPQGMGKYKRSRYGAEQEYVSYWRNGTVIFTVLKKNDFRTSQPIILVLTIIDQRVTLRQLS